MTGIIDHERHFVDRTAKATRSLAVRSDGSPLIGDVAATQVVVTGIGPVTPVLILPANPLRTRALILTDANVAMFIGGPTVSAATGFFIVYGPVPIEIRSTSALWAINASGVGVLNSIRAWVETRVE